MKLMKYYQEVLKKISQNSSKEEFSETDKKDILLTVKIFVETGANNDEEIEITKGLSIGDIIVLEGANNVEDNQRVRVIE